MTTELKILNYYLQVNIRKYTKHYTVQANNTKMQ